MSWFYDPALPISGLNNLELLVGLSARADSVEPWKAYAIVTDLEGGIVAVYERHPPSQSILSTKTTTYPRSVNQYPLTCGPLLFFLPQRHVAEQPRMRGFRP